ncbi:MAG: hypothetical protein IJZ66_09175, partial [Oscillibacter sp.]|nr:hypothetical protein [Oscillibacter sp.]
MGDALTFEDALYAMLLPSSNVTANAIARVAGEVILEEDLKPGVEKEPEPLSGKKLSILGASISTYENVSSGAAAQTTNSTIGSNKVYYTEGRWGVSLEDTWWMQVVSDLGLELLVNNAWSGSAILLERSGTPGAYVDRCVQLHDDTGANAGTDPDIICIQMGFNDFSYGKSTLGTADIDYDALITAGGYGTPATTMEATAIMLDKMVKRYPDAEVYMFSHFKRVNQSAADTALMEQLNADIKTVCGRFGVTVVDLYSVLGEKKYVGDGNLHPNALGMDVITEAVKDAILGNHEDEETCTVTCDLTNVTTDCIGEKTILTGRPFTAEFAAESGYALDITVTMGGKDITKDCVANGVVAIAAVTDDVTITARGTFSLEDHLQQLPEDVCCETNLWTALEPENVYYTASGWGNNSNSNYSVTFPVSAGDKVWATSFGPAGENGYTANGVRVTWFGADGVIASLSRDEVYAEFAANGCLTAPAGAVALNVPMVSNSTEWEIYVLTLDHSYKGGICTACGASALRWENGTIAAATGVNAANTTRTRTANLLSLNDYSGVDVGSGYQLTYFAYDAAGKYLGNGTSDLVSNWLGDG